MAVQPALRKYEFIFQLYRKKYAEVVVKEAGIGYKVVGKKSLVPGSYSRLEAAIDGVPRRSSSWDASLPSDYTAVAPFLSDYNSDVVAVVPSLPAPDAGAEDTTVCAAIHWGTLDAARILMP
jgi:hypothetical protein